MNLMETLVYSISITVIIIGSLLHLLRWKPLNLKILLRAFKERHTPLPVTYDNAVQALDRMASWTTWLTGLQTAAIAAVGLLFKDRELSDYDKYYGFGTLLFFGSSILLATWLLSSLPSIQQRLVKKEKENTTFQENDIYTKEIFHFIPIQMGGFAGLIHTYFIIGIIFFTLSVFSVIKHPTPANKCKPNAKNAIVIAHQSKAFDFLFPLKVHSRGLSLDN